MTKLNAGLIIVLSLLLFGTATTTVLAYQAHNKYLNLIVPNVSIAGINLSGLDELAATTKLQKAYDTMIENGLQLTIGNSTQTVSLFHTSNSDIAYNLLEWNTAEAAKAALRVGHSTNAVTDSLFVLYHEWFGDTTYTANVTVNNDRLTEAVRATFPEAIISATDTKFTVTWVKGKDPVVTVVAGDDGQTINIADLLTSTTKDAADLNLKPTTLSTIKVEPNITAEEASTAIAFATKALVAAPYNIQGTLTDDTTKIWTKSAKTLADWIIPVKNSDNIVTIGLDASKMIDFYTELHTAVDLPAQNARFRIDGGRVTEFQPSKSGTVLDDDIFFATFNNALGTDTSIIPLILTMRTEEPSTTTANVNSFGISEIVGQATTSFASSPVNRKANIAHGAEKLNGLLIAPGETISLLASLRPFTIAGGYLPELVIKGDEIKPEIGGGLCQIGTTAFRAAMMTGLKIVERRNHSLAVSYYNDPSNGNPGTDATLYDPAPDFKFKNDMPTYLLLATSYNAEKSEITFTFWGIKDGRTGSYTPPTVLTRSGVGATQYKETDTLAPGIEKCQNAYPGATATFDYNITYGTGETKTETFFSSYRALPKICLVGKELQAQ